MQSDIEKNYKKYNDYVGKKVGIVIQTMYSTAFTSGVLAELSQHGVTLKSNNSEIKLLEDEVYWILPPVIFDASGNLTKN